MRFPHYHKECPGALWGVCGSVMHIKCALLEAAEEINQWIIEWANGGKETRGCKRREERFLKGSEKEHLNWKNTLSPLSSALIPSLLSSLWDAVWRIVIVTAGLVCWGHCVHRLRMFLVLLFSERPETQKDAFRPAGIISSDKWRPKALEKFDLRPTGFRPLLTDSVCKRCRSSD